MASNKLERVIKSSVRKVVNQKVREASQATFNEVSASIERDVLSHPISKELLTTTDSSSFFSTPKGSLFGFMGFKKGRNPIQELINYFKGGNGVRFSFGKYNVSSSQKRVSITLSLPSNEELAQNGIVLDGWSDGRSWTEVIETGMTGLSKFFSSDKFGRSTKGFQSQKTLNSSDSLGSIPYLTPIFERAKERFARTLIKRLK